MKPKLTKIDLTRWGGNFKHLGPPEGRDAAAQSRQIAGAQSGKQARSPTSIRHATPPSK